MESPAELLGALSAFLGTTGIVTAVINSVVAGAVVALIVHAVALTSPTWLGVAVGVASALTLTAVFWPISVGDSRCLTPPTRARDLLMPCMVELCCCGKFVVGCIKTAKPDYFTTPDAHRPPKHRAVIKLNHERLREWAQAIGSAGLTGAFSTSCWSSSQWRLSRGFQISRVRMWEPQVTLRV